MQIDKKPLVSIVMPAYNASRFISRAIDSVLTQTYSDIELVIVDDASTDNTCDIIHGYKDNRIKIIEMPYNSGSAYMPRYTAYKESSGQYVLGLDADDYLESTYVEQLLARLLKHRAEICCSWNILVDEDEKLLGNQSCIPKPDFDFDKQMTGREAFFLTVPGWKIGMAGCLATREAWKYGYSRTSKLLEHGIHDDEIVSRYMLLYAKTVVISKQRYYYRMNKSSVTHVFNDKIFDYIRAEIDFMYFIEVDYGNKSEEYQAVVIESYRTFLYIRQEVINTISSVDIKDALMYLDQLKMWHARLDWKTLKEHMSYIKNLKESNYYVAMIYRMLRKGKIKLLLRWAITVK